ncbi:hypothetical protein OJ996_25080 [Luteolibacter sp. GHJ8]|jgi:hypothetical protein|uniref:Uncharacterized protein n=1 Tax=Luteolibacter rhizosphaerae TaxID=2989719 RepID=A0ABT3GAL5_9BACT|nr:hypothetical protein [Luteolibacter rhizosphaerae]MCW1916887.1 hypothetical protein [Luteolibacter rhizosphaerae]
MNAGLHKLLSLGASLSIGLGVGVLAKIGHRGGIPRAAVVIDPPPESMPPPQIVTTPERGLPDPREPSSASSGQRRWQDIFHLIRTE